MGSITFVMVIRSPHRVGSWKFESAVQERSLSWDTIPRLSNLIKSPRERLDINRDENRRKVSFKCHLLNGIF